MHFVRSGYTGLKFIFGGARYAPPLLPARLIMVIRSVHLQLNKAESLQTVWNIYPIFNII